MAKDRNDPFARIRELEAMNVQVLADMLFRLEDRVDVMAEQNGHLKDQLRLESMRADDLERENKVLRSIMMLGVGDDR